MSGAGKTGKLGAARFQLSSRPDSAA